MMHPQTTISDDNDALPDDNDAPPDDDDDTPPDDGTTQRSHNRGKRVSYKEDTDSEDGVSQEEEEEEVQKVLRPETQSPRGRY